jgi:hypothetical protein
LKELCYNFPGKIKKPNNDYGDDDNDVNNNNNNKIIIVRVMDIMAQ